MCFCTFIYCVFVFFFKQKTAYEMRISDWSSDVCSSDLLHGDLLRRHLDAHRVVQHLGRQLSDLRWHGSGEQQRVAPRRQGADDLSDIADEAHVEHAVGLVEDEVDRKSTRLNSSH